MVKAIIFDYFGVVCSDEYWNIVKEDKNLKHGVFHELSNQVNLGQISWEDFITNIAQKTGRSVDEMQSLYKSQRIQPSMVAYIAQLHKQYKTALLSNAHYEFLEPIITAAQLDELFDTIVMSSRVGVVKPSAEIYNFALRKLGVKPTEAIMIDDMTRHVEGARAVGMQAIYYENFGQMKRDLDKLLHES